MKKMLLFLLALSQILSINAMHPDMYAQLEAIHQTFKLDRKVVPFDKDSHGDKPLSIFYRGFGFYLAALRVSNSTISPQTKPVDRIVNVLLLDNKPIGVLTCHDVKYTDGSITRCLDHFTIDEKYRGTKANHALYFIEKFEEKALNDGISRIELYSFERALNFYKKAGYKIFSGKQKMEKILKKSEDTF